MTENPKKLDLTTHFMEGERILHQALATINPTTGRPWRHILIEREAGGYLLTDRLRNIVSWLVRSGPEISYDSLDEDDADMEARFGLPIRLAALHGAIDAHATTFMAHFPYAFGDLSNDQLAVVLTSSEDRWERLGALGFGADRPWQSTYPLALATFAGWKPPVDLSGSAPGLLVADCTDDEALITSMRQLGVVQVITH